MRETTIQAESRVQDLKARLNNALADTYHMLRELSEYSYSDDFAVHTNQIRKPQLLTVQDAEHGEIKGFAAVVAKEDAILNVKMILNEIDLYGLAPIEKNFAKQLCARYIGGFDLLRKMPEVSALEKHIAYTKALLISGEDFMQNCYGRVPMRAFNF